jgi:hypothetical protein
LLLAAGELVWQALLERAQAQVRQRFVDSPLPVARSRRPYATFSAVPIAAGLRL